MLVYSWRPRCNHSRCCSFARPAAVRREIKILRLFMHPHIIRLYEVVETSNDIYVVMEYVKASPLQPQLHC